MYGFVPRLHSVPRCQRQNLRYDLAGVDCDASWIVVDGVDAEPGMAVVDADSGSGIVEAGCAGCGFQAWKHGGKIEVAR